jgi:uncharacterized repeat protein (TIGR01451 family)
MKLKVFYGLAAFLLYAIFVRPGLVHAQPNELSASDSIFDPNIALTAQLPSGSIGLPGESITWYITVSNNGLVSGTNVVVSDTLQPELRVDHAHTQTGDLAISDQTVVFSIPVLEPGQTVQMQIHTTVVRSPANGIVVNQALLAARSPNGPITRKTTAEIFLPTTLPATGYPPGSADLPGDGEPSALQIGLAAFAVVLVAALVVWYRGRKSPLVV